MGEEKSARYTIILGVCLLLCLLMLGRMLVGRSESEAPPDGTEPVETVPEEQQEPQLSLVMTMSESDLANFLLQYLPFTPRGLSVSIGADETASMSMSVDRAELEESGLLTGHFRAAAQLLPERCSLAGKWGVRAEQGRLQFTCLSAQLNDADLPQTAAELVGHSPQRIHEWIREETLTGIKLGTIQYCAKAEFIGFMASPQRLAHPYTEKYKELIREFKYIQRRERENEQRRQKRKMMKEST